MSYTPNDALRAARETARLTQGQLADLVKDMIERETGKECAIDADYVGKLERGFCRRASSARLAGIRDREADQPVRADGRGPPRTCRPPAAVLRRPYRWPAALYLRVPGGRAGRLSERRPRPATSPSSAEYSPGRSPSPTLRTMATSARVTLARSATRARTVSKNDVKCAIISV